MNENTDLIRGKITPGKDINRAVQSQEFEMPDLKHAYDLLTAEENKDFYNYIEWLGFIRGPGMIVLLPEHHYYYDADDLINIRKVVNIMPLNQINNPKNFRGTIFRLVPDRCLFTGCFKENCKKNFLIREGNAVKTESYDYGILSRIPLVNIIYNLLDMRTNAHLSQKSVTLMLENKGFTVIDMTELNDRIYFYARKVLTN
ncbi:MAG: hypothetical protein JXN62_03810 [Bacteroidales bacterium]|nr:hypothetical protein [Bacteroidales bacterium]